MSHTRWILPFAMLAACATAAPSPASTTQDTQSVTLQWTAPGDDGWTGTARLYEIRYSTTPLTATNFLFGTRLPTTVLPGPAGSKQTLTVLGLTPGIPYYFAIRTMDEAGNWSALSNVARVSPGAEQLALRSLNQATIVPISFAEPRPNPSRSSAQFAVTLPGPNYLRIEAFDIGGRKVRTIAMGEYAAGAFDLRWDLRDDSGQTLQPGTYLVRGQLGEQVFMRRVTVLR